MAVGRGCAMRLMVKKNCMFRGLVLKGSMVQLRYWVKGTVVGAYRVKRRWC